MEERTAVHLPTQVITQLPRGTCLYLERSTLHSRATRHWSAQQIDHCRLTPSSSSPSFCLMQTPACAHAPITQTLCSNCGPGARRSLGQGWNQAVSEPRSHPPGYNTCGASRSLADILLCWICALTFSAGRGGRESLGVGRGDPWVTRRHPYGRAQHSSFA